MMTIRSLVLTLASALVAVPSLAQVDWLSEEMEQTAAGGLLVRLSEVGAAMPGSPAEQADQALELTRDITGRIDDWGIDGIIERAPEYADIELPEFDNPLVSTIANYGLCTLMLDPNQAESRDELVAMVLSEHFVMLVTAYLRDWLVDTGGDDEELEAALASDAMNELAREVEGSDAKMGAVRGECGPMFVALFAP